MSLVPIWIKWPLAFLATSDVNSPPLSPKPESWDVHVYQTPGQYQMVDRVILSLTLCGNHRLVPRELFHL
jgi:hypothetical protein